MERCRIVPAIDLIDGRCVRLKQGAFEDSDVVAEDPVAAAKDFEQQGYRRLHLVDLNGARTGKPYHLDVLQKITHATRLSVDFSGGLRTREDVAAALSCGADAVVIGSAAVLAPELLEALLSSLPSEQLIVGLDTLDGEVRIKGWKEGSGASLDTILERFLPCGLTRLMSTSIRCDGMLSGPDFQLYESLKSTYPALNVIASGGVSSADDVVRLAQCGVAEVIVGKALYAGRITPQEVQAFVW